MTLVTDDSNSVARGDQKQPAHLWWSLPAISIAVLSLITFGKCLYGYFAADDIWQTAYAFKALNGHPEMICRKFFENYVPGDVVKFYRPLLMVSVIGDYAVWGANPFGYHLTNVLLQTASSVLLFFCVRKLFACVGPQRATVIGAIAGALFAVSPLHGEVAAWQSARVDSLCETFYFLALWQFAESSTATHKRKKLIFFAISLIAFVLSMLSKETGVTLPVLACGWMFLFQSDGPLVSRIKRSLWTTRWFWLFCVIFVCVRAAILQTFVGGYMGSIGSVVIDWSSHPPMFKESILKFAVPVDSALINSENKYMVQIYTLLEYLAVLCASVNVVRSRRIRWREWLFAFFWLVLCIAPVLQVWELTDTLRGARYAFSITAPLGVLFALALVPVDEDSVRLRGTILNRVSAAVLAAFLCASSLLAALNCDAWLVATQGVQTIRESMFKIYSIVHNQFALIAFPHEYAGSHMLYNGTTLAKLLAPPFSDQDISKYVLTFEAVKYSAKTFIDSNRLRRCYSANHDMQAWIASMDVSKIHDQTALLMIHRPARKTFQFNTPPALPLVLKLQGMPSALNYDFVDVTLKLNALPAPGRKPYVALWWKGYLDRKLDLSRRIAIPLEPTTEPQTVRFCVSDQKNWILTERMSILQIDGMASSEATISSVTVLSGEKAIPALEPDESRANSTGIVAHEDSAGIMRSGQTIGCFNYDASQIEGADHVVWQLSPKNWWYEDTTDHLLNRSLPEKYLARGDFGNAKSVHAELKLPKLSPGYYELLIAAVDKTGKQTGYCSYPLNLEIE